MNATATTPTALDTAPADEPLIFGADHAARILGVAGRKQVYRLVHEQGLPFIPMGERSMGFTREGLKGWTTERETRRR